MSDTIRFVIPLTIRKRNGRPKILPPENAEGMDSRTQDPPRPAGDRPGMGLAAAHGGG